MAKLIYSTICSLDGYVADEDGDFSWAAPSEELHAFVNELERPIGTHLYGRRMYETMVVWETMDVTDEPPVMGDFAAIWRAAEKVVYSTSLSEPGSARTRVESRFDPAEVRRMKEAADRDLSIGGPTLAAAAFAADLIDEAHVFLVPAIVGGGTRAFPDGARLDLELLAQRRFDPGTVHLHYRVGRR